MARRRKNSGWGEILPPQVEWLLLAVFFVAWGGGSVPFYWKVLGRVEHLFAALAPLGMSPDESALKPVAEMAFKYAPFAALPVAIGVWQWARRKLLDSFAAL